RGRPAARANAGAEAALRDRRLPRAPPPARAAGERAAHEDERAHAQGPQEDRRPREEGQVMFAVASRVPRTLRGAANLRIAASSVASVASYERSLRPCAAWFSRPQSTRFEGGDC